MHRHIGIYPGTFDPVHDGHVAFAKHALELFHFDQIVFLPEKTPRRKEGASDILVRQTILSDALLPIPKLESLVLESDQFTVHETLPKLHQMLPGSKFTFLMGSDVALHLPSWQDVPLLIADVSFLVAMREGDSRIIIDNTFKKIGESYQTPIRYTIIDSPRPSLRSSALRNK
jgi:nicotinate-nucleotide adenylyltransferase